ncbi:Zinc finger C3HC4-type RING finger family protein [Quillaja saponaria]|uniref:Zinc finger C3HC4-type RING finger family protein n=1 Tax=Quillaja saponaria TaxID=32244 RepID=A0AAD7PFT3_QUISA|nr:Zinc finger C3HC4-type RING finger family protein [Quillaja saponaria]
MEKRKMKRSRCGICLRSVKTGQGTAIFTAECSHAFHFPCIAAHIKKQEILFCPVCSTNWKELPLLETQIDNDQNLKHGSEAAEKNRARSHVIRDVKIKSLRVYDDDEPLMSPNSVARFNPIPESDENEDDQEKEQQYGTVNFQGETIVTNLEVKVSQEAAILAVGRSDKTYAVVLKVKAPAFPTVNGGGCGRTSKTVARRAPVDLVTVIDVSGTMTDPKLQMVKRSMRLLISSLSSADRLSIIVFSCSSKRLLPLRRMTSNGQRSARRIVDALVAIELGREASIKNDAVKKAAKVLEDRRQKNPIASILVLSYGQEERVPTTTNQKGFSPVVITTRSSHMEIPVHSVSFVKGSACSNAHPEEAFAKCLIGLLSVVAQNLRLQLSVVSRSAPVEVTAVYSLTGKPSVLGSGFARLGDLYADEERELLVELKVPSASTGSHHVLTVRSSYKDPSSQEVVYSEEQAMLLPRPQAVRSSDPKIERLRNLHVTTRAIAESSRLIDHNDLSGAHHLLHSARALLLHSSPKTADEQVHCLEAEQAELQHRRQQQLHSQRQRVINNRVVEPLTPTSAWRAAERLAKVAIMKKHMNRVSDLHGFENARF